MFSIRYKHISLRPHNDSLYQNHFSSEKRNRRNAVDATVNDESPQQNCLELLS